MLKTTHYSWTDAVGLTKLFAKKAVFEYTHKARSALFFRIFPFRILYTFSHRKIRIFIFAFYTSSNSHFRIFAFRILYVI